MPEQTGPLSPETFDELKEQLKALEQAELEISRAQRAGIDVSGQAERARELRTKLTQLRTAYFPGRI